jgi:hypothetical protein
MLQNLSKVLFTLGLGIIVTGVLQAAAPARPQGPTPQQIQQMQQQMQQAQQQAMQHLQQLMQQQQQQAQRMQQQMANQARVLGPQLARQAQQAARQARNAPRPGYQETITNYDFTFSDVGLVRTMAPLTQELDDKGRPRKLDAAEMKKAKGDSPQERKLAGYKATFEDVQVGDQVTVTLARYVPKRSLLKSKDKEDADEEKPAKKKDADDEEKLKKDAEAKAKKEEKDAEKDKAKDKDKDAEKEKGDKEKGETTKGKEKEEDAEAAAAAAELWKGRTEWRNYGKLTGTVAEVDSSGSKRLTLRIKGQQVVMQRPGQGAPAAAEPKTISIDPSQLQATMIVIVRRGTGVDAAGGGGGGFGDAFKK